MRCRPASLATVALILAAVVPACGRPERESPSFPRTIHLAYAGGVVTSSDLVGTPPATLRVRQHDNVVMRWTSTEPLTVHLHGYEVRVDVRPGTPAELGVLARVAGRFVIEGHAGPDHAGTPVAYLEVLPR